MTTDLAVIGSAIVLLTAVWAVTAHLINREPTPPGSHARRHRSLRAAWRRTTDAVTAARFARRYTRDQRREHEIWGDTGTTGTLPAVAESAPLAPLPADTTVYEVGELPRPVTTLNSPGSHELPAPQAGGLNHHPDCERTGDSCLICEACAEEVSRLFDWPTDAAKEVTSWASSPVGHAATADSGLMPAVTEHIAAALGVPSRTRWLDDGFDRVLLELHAEMALIGHRFAYAGATA